jgi:hypothetical protein
MTAGVRDTAKLPRLFVDVMLMLISGELFGQYGQIVSLVMIPQAGNGSGAC